MDEFESQSNILSKIETIITIKDVLGKNATRQDFDRKKADEVLSTEYSDLRISMALFDLFTSVQPPFHPYHLTEWMADYNEAFRQPEKTYEPEWMSVGFANEDSPFKALMQLLEERKPMMWHNEDRGYIEYTSDAIRLAFHINQNADTSKRDQKYYPNVYPEYGGRAPMIHPLFQVNSLRWMLDQNMFTSLEDAINFITAPEPIFTYGQIFKKSEKIIPIKKIPPNRPIAFIHGRFRIGFTHPAHEKAIRVLQQEKENHPDLLVVLGMDSLALDSSLPHTVFYNEMWRASLLKELVDYVIVLKAPTKLLDIFSPLNFGNPNILSNLGDRTLRNYYAYIYDEVFKNTPKDGRYLFISMNNIVERISDMLGRCMLSEIKPRYVSTFDEWSSSLIYGSPKLPDKITDPNLNFDYYSAFDAVKAIHAYEKWFVNNIIKNYVKSKYEEDWLKERYLEKD